MSARATPPSPSHTTPSAPSFTVPSASSISCHTIASTTLSFSPLSPRIHALLVSLYIIKHSLSARSLLQNLTIHHGRFCLACFRRRHTPGTCGPTCALFRRGGRNNFYRPAEASTRGANLRRDYTAYSRIVREMHASRGRHVAEAVLKGWEEAVKVLAREGETFSERVERVGWGEMEARRKWEHFGGWEFEGAWGKGDKEEEAVPPELLVKEKLEKEEAVPPELLVKEKLEKEEKEEWKERKITTRSMT